MSKGIWQKKHESDKIWWLADTGSKGECIFSFDKETEYAMYRDFPWNLTEEQVEIFIAENPFWAKYFTRRIDEYKKGERKQ